MRCAPRRRNLQVLRELLRDGAAALRFLEETADAFTRRRLVLAILAVLAASMLAAVGPVLMKSAIDGLDTRSEGFVIAPLLLILAYIAGQWLARGMNELRWLFHGRAEQRLIRRLSLRIFAHLLALPLGFHLERETGALTRTLGNGLLGYRIVLQHLVFSLMPVVLELAAMAVILGHLYKPDFLLILGLTAMAYMTAFALGAVRITEPVRAASASEIEAGAVMTDALINYETIKCFGAERDMQDRLDKALTHGESHWSRYYRSRTNNGLAVALIFALSLATVLLLTAREVERGLMTVGDFVLVNAYFLQIVAPLEVLGLAFRDLAQGMAFIRRLQAIMKVEPERAAGRDLPRGSTGELIFERVHFAYRKGRPILEDVSFTIPGGRNVAIVGASGSGKSTLIRLLLRLVEPDEGRILLDGVPIDDLALENLRRAVAVVPQDVALLNQSVADNIALGQPAGRPSAVEQAAVLARIGTLVDGLPRGYRTPVGERGIKLSGGERQRLAIARAAMKASRVFVLDEATSSLDSRTERRVLRSLRDAMQGITTILIAHRLATVRDADEILVLEGGRIVERGTHETLLQGNGPYTALWQAQQQDGAGPDPAGNAVAGA